MEVEIISTSCITPSSPPPPHLQTYKLSLLDQFCPSNYLGSILFYPNSRETNTIAERSQSLKQSLSETLSRFYPYGGKIKDNLIVDCADVGLYYTDAKCKISLSQFLTQPDLLTTLHKLFPKATSDELPSGSPVALIQETTFACGGFSIGMYFSHIVCDAYSQALFLKDWAATARKVAAQRHPFLGVESIFPQWKTFPREKILTAYVCDRFARIGKSITKRMVFKESAIANLKAKSSSNNINNPTRSEAVIAFFIQRLMICFKNRTGNNHPLATTIAMNIRRKGELQPLVEHSLGNVLSIAAAVFKSEEEEKKELSEIVNQLREALGIVDNEFIMKIKSNGDEIFKYHNSLKEIMGSQNAREYSAFSSLCNFGVYDIDFGWGKPIWAVFFPWFEYTPEVPTFNGVLLMDTRTGKGVEAWISLLQQDFDILEKDTQLLQYASINPSPLIYNSFEPTSKL